MHNHGRYQRVFARESRHEVDEIYDDQNVGQVTKSDLEIESDLEIPSVSSKQVKNKVVDSLNPIRKEWISLTKCTVSETMTGTHKKMLSLKGSKSDTVDGENAEIKPADRLGTIPIPTNLPNTKSRTKSPKKWDFWSKSGTFLQI